MRSVCIREKKRERWRQNRYRDREKIKYLSLHLCNISIINKSIKINWNFVRWCWTRKRFFFLFCRALSSTVELLCSVRVMGSVPCHLMQLSKALLILLFLLAFRIVADINQKMNHLTRSTDRRARQQLKLFIWFTVTQICSQMEY